MAWIDFFLKVQNFPLNGIAVCKGLLKRLFPSTVRILFTCLTILQSTTESIDGKSQSTRSVGSTTTTSQSRKTTDGSESTTTGREKAQHESHILPCHFIINTNTLFFVPFNISNIFVIALIK